LWAYRIGECRWNSDRYCLVQRDLSGCIDSHQYLRTVDQVHFDETVKSMRTY